MADLVVDNLRFLDRGPYRLRIRGGECLGLSGDSGVGKSLLLRAVVDLDPNEGRVLLGEIDRAAVPAPRWRQLVGLLPAESFWWQDLVDEHFHDFSALSDQELERLGFDRTVGSWRVSRLSTGEKQRLAILRLLENRPQALLLDEPTASLDADNIHRVEDLFTGYCRQRQAPLLWVSHDPDQLCRVADRLAVMGDQGILHDLETDHDR